MRPSIRLGVSLATIGVAVSVTIVALGAHFLLGLPWELALLLGAVTSPTDAAAVFSVLRVVPLPKKLTGALEAESGLNDAPTVVLVDPGLLRRRRRARPAGPVRHHRLRAGGRHRHRPRRRLRRRLGDAPGGAPVVRPLPARRPLPRRSWRTAPPPSVHASGFAAVYVAALVLGNMELPHRAATRSFAEGVAWLAQIGLFVMLGLLLSPGRITWETVGLAVLAGLILTFVARPLSVLVSSSCSRCRGASWASSPGPACAAPCRSC